MHQAPPIGEEHRNPLLDTRVYELELLDGRSDEYAVNINIENIIDQVDEKKWTTKSLEQTVAFCCDPDVAIQTGDQEYKNTNGIQRPVITTNGLDVQVKLSYRKNDWFLLHLIKDSNSIEVA